MSRLVALNDTAIVPGMCFSDETNVFTATLECLRVYSSL